MAREAISRFFSEVIKDRDLKASLDLLAGEDLVAAAVQAGARLNCAFSAEEFRDVMRAAAVRKAGGELSEQQLESVAGGRKAGGGQQEYLVIKMNDVIITSVTPG
jgi:hypothetical protein